MPSRIISFCLYVVFAAVMILVISQKKDLFVDEFFSYSCANHQGGKNIEAEIENGYTYEPSDLVWCRLLTVDPAHRFDYRNIWLTEAHNAHPPLYYVLLHTISSLFPGRFSIWFGAAINISFALMTLFVIRKLIALLENDPRLKLILSMGFIFSAGILSMTAYLRMYLMVLFFITLTAYLFAKAVVKDRMDARFYISVYTAAVLGAETHYYYLVYLVLTCFVFGIYLIIKRRFISLAVFSGSMAAAAGSAILIFPAMLKAMFSGQRGSQALDSLQDGNKLKYADSLQFYYGTINVQLFGGLLTYILAFVLLFFAVFFFRHLLHGKAGSVSGKTDGKLPKSIEHGALCADSIFKWLILFIPTALYYLLIAKIAPYKTDRYIFPIYGTAYVLAGIVLYKLICRAVRGEKARICVMLLLCSAVAVCSWSRIPWRYLVRDRTAVLETAKQNADLNVILVYGHNHSSRTMNAWYEVSCYHSLTFIPDDDLKLLDTYKYRNDKKLVILAEDEEMLKSCLAELGNTYSYKEMSWYAYLLTYYVSRTDG